LSTRTFRHTSRMREYPVRCGVSVESLKSLDYWITRFSCAVAHKAGR
jgi:hypothetical protein